MKVRKDRETPQGFPIVLYININNKRLNFYTDLFIKNPSYLINNKISKKDPLWSEKNTKITEIISKTNIILMKYSEINDIKTNINYLLNHKIKQEKKLSDYIKDYMSLKSGKTKQLYQSTLNKLLTSGMDKPIEEIDIHWIQTFDNYCSQNMRINGKSVYLRNIRTVFNYLIDEGKINNYPFRKFKIKSEETSHRALSIDQLKSLICCPCKEYQYKYRDIFLLMIYLIGINPKDLLYLTKDNIINERIVYHRAKTGKLYSIKLEPEALHIINIYKGEKYLLRFIEKNKDYLAFVRHMNKRLKNLNIIPGLTSYWARHTWASIAFEIGIPKDIISLALGHSIGVKVTDIYIRYNLEKVDEANRKVIDYINKNSSIFTDRGETKPKNESHEK